MLTLEQALNAREFHYTGKHECSFEVGPRGGTKLNITSCRRNGKTQTWKTRPNDFRVPVKYGLYEYAQITNADSNDWHTPEECPALIAQEEHFRKQTSAA